MRPNTPALAEHLRLLTILGLAIVSGVVLFGGVVWYLVNVGGFSGSTEFPAYAPLLANVLALAIILKAQFLSRFFRPPDHGASEETVLAWHKRNTIVGFALREGAAFVALVAVLLTGQQVGGFAVAILAVVSMLLAWPRAEQLDGLL